MIVITGWRSTIAEEFSNLLPAGEEAVRAAGGDPAIRIADRYLFCHGLLRPLRADHQSDAQIGEGVRVNYSTIARSCRRVLAANPKARICIIGSESGYRGSHDGVYAAAKHALHRFIETERIGPDQQLVGVSPGIIADCGMTLRRTDTDNLEERRLAHPKQRFLTAREVAAMAHFLLYVDAGYTTGTVIRMHGGL